MVAEIKQALVNKLNELYAATVYDEFIPQEFDEGSFFVTVVEHSYAKAIADKYISSVSFDLSYFPADKNNLRNECLTIAETILREFDLLDGFRILLKTAQIVDEVLHIQFTVKYRESASEAEIKMKDIKF